MENRSHSFSHSHRLTFVCLALLLPCKDSFVVCLIAKKQTVALDFRQTNTGKESRTMLLSIAGAGLRACIQRLRKQLSLLRSWHHHRCSRHLLPGWWGRRLSFRECPVSENSTVTERSKNALLCSLFRNASPGITFSTAFRFMRPFCARGSTRC